MRPSAAVPPEYGVSPMWAIPDTAIIVAILFGNVLTIAAVRCNRHLRRLPSNKFIVSLAAGDLFLGCILPLHMTLYLCPAVGEIKPVCLLQFVLLILGGLVSFFNILAIAIDRYVAILYPLHYIQYMTDRTIALIVVAIWMLSFVIASVPIYWNNYDAGEYCPMDDVLHPQYVRFVVTPLYVIIWSIMFCVYWRIWLEASRHARRMRKHSTNVEVTDWKSVRVVLMVLGCFTVCWLPYFVLACARSFGLFNTSIYKGTYSLAMANSGMNPMIYAWKNSDFREAFGRMLRCRSPKVIPRKLSKLTKAPETINNVTVSTISLSVCQK